LPSTGAEPSVIAGNTVRGVPGSGIIAYRQSSLQITDNTIADAGRRGIHLSITSNSELRGNEISGSGLEAPGRYDGIELEQGSSNNRIVANRIHRSSGMRNPIGIAAGCLGNQVLNNLVEPD